MVLHAGEASIWFVHLPTYQHLPNHLRSVLARLYVVIRKLVQVNDHVSQLEAGPLPEDEPKKEQ